MLRWLVDRMHVGTSDAAVVRDIARRALKAGKLTKAERKAMYRKALDIHRDNRALYRSVMAPR